MGFPLQCRDDGRRHSEDCLGLQGGQLPRQGCILACIRSRKAMVDADCTAFHPTEAYESVLEFRKLPVPLNVVLGGFLQHGNASHTLTERLRVGHKWPDRGHAAERGHKCSASDVDCHRGTISRFSERRAIRLRCKSLEPPMSQLGQHRLLALRLH